MGNNLTEKDMEELAKYGETIRISLECDANGKSVPCRTDRLFAVEFMKRYLVVHGYKVTRDDNLDGDEVVV